MDLINGCEMSTNKSKLKVLSLLWGFSLGGIAKYALNLHGMNALEGANVSIETACIYGTGWGTDLASLQSINAHLIPISGRADFTWIQRTSHLIDSLRPDLLLVHGFNGPVIAKICLNRSNHSCGFACSYHGLYSAPKMSRRPLVPFINFLQEYIYKTQAKAVVTVCDFSRKYLVSRGVPNDKLTAIHNGIAPSCVTGNGAELRAELGLKEDDFVIGVASRLDPFKGINFMIDALPELLDKEERIKLVIFGEGSYRERLERQCRRLGLEGSVHFCGYRANIPRWLSIFDLYVLPSLAESHSIGLLEAMRAGLPIVATDVGGNPESIIDGVSGMIVRPGEPGDLVRAISKCLQDEALCQSLGLNARIRFEAEFTLEKQLLKTAEWLSLIAD